MSEDKLAAALAAFQADLPVVVKDKTANMGTYTVHYADLASLSKVVLPALAKHGLSFSSKPTIEDGRFVLVYTLRHSSGEEDRGVYPLPPNGTPQQTGSAITYARRYALSAIAGVAADEDDDGKAAADTKVDAAAREFAWDPITQETYRAGWEAEIQDAKDNAQLDDIAKRLVAAKKPNAEERISPANFDHLKIAVVARRGELKKAGEVAPDAPAEQSLPI